MPTVLKRYDLLVKECHPPHEPVFIDAVDIINIERAVAAGAGAVDEYRSTGSEELDELQVRTMITKALIAADVDPAKLYAFLTVGCLVTVDNVPRLAATQVDQWRNAVNEHRSRQFGHA